MNKIFSLLLILSLMVSCKTTADKSSNAKETVTETGSNADDLNYYFKATGNEPFWGIKIGKEKTVFTSTIKGLENLTFDSAVAIPAMDSNIKMYNLSNDKAVATITIQQVDCQDSMSG